MSDGNACDQCGRSFRCCRCEPLEADCCSVYTVRETVCDFYPKPFVYLDIDGKSGVLSPWLNLQAGDEVIIRRKNLKVRAAVKE